jgi:hypothetical protein
MRYPTVLLCSVLVLAGCQTAPDVQQLQDQNASLQNQLTQANNKNDTLTAEQTLLKQENTELNRVITVLGQEKSSRVEESTGLRGDVRQFVQLQIDNLKQFLLKSNLADYIGGELVERQQRDAEPVLLVDRGHPVPRHGTLTAVSAFFTGPGTMTVKVLRPVGEELVVVWESDPIIVRELGNQRLSFNVSISVERDDVLAYYLEPGMVGFDTGTGEMGYRDEDIHVGGVIGTSSLLGDGDKRSYAIGVIGLLNAE